MTTTIMKQLEAGVYRGTPRLRLYDAETGWRGWKVGGSHQRMLIQQPEQTDIMSPNRTDEGTYASPVVKFSVNTGSLPFVIDFDNPSKDVLAISLSAILVSQSIAAGTSVEVTRMSPEPGGEVMTGYDDISNVAVNREDGENADDWVGSTAYVVGDFVVPTTPNQHFYKCTTAGTSDVSEPTFPTDGTTVTDGTVVWQDMGLIIAAVTDYSVTRADQGILSLPETGGNIVVGESLRIVLDHAAVEKSVYRKDRQVNVYGQFSFYGRNLAKAQQVRIYSLWCHIKGVAEADMAQSDNLIIRTIEVTPMEPDWAAEGLEIPPNWISGDHSRYETIDE